ncbi:MAG: hypothetical protein ABIR57_00430 [Aeromicrobium sp.]
MIQCLGCGEDEALRGVALDDGRREITCERCGHSWTRGAATRVAPPPTPSRRSARPTSAQCGPRWDDDTVVATLNRETSNLESPGPDGVPLSFVPRREPTWNAGDPVRTNRLFSYIVVHDTGFSPNPFHSLLTLACCKPLIRRTANVGDIIVGLSSRSERIVYATQVAEVIAFEEYWSDPRYHSRRPVMDSPQIVDRAGDNIYEPVPGGYRQLPSFHSSRDGSEDLALKRADLSGNHVLVCERFTYWGRSGPALPEELQFLAVGRGHRSNFTSDQVSVAARWFADLPGGVLGAPAQWKAGDQSWRES